MTGAWAGRVVGLVSRQRIRHHGLWFDVGSSDFSPQVRARMFWGVYERAETRMIRSFLRNSTTVVELGSSLGVTTAHIATLMVPAGRLICVEADPRLLRGLRRRIVPWAATLQVDVVHAAVTSHCGTTSFTLAAETVGSRVGSPRPHETVIRVPALTLREILHRTKVAEFDLVSDIEGAEAAFLLQDPGALNGCRRAVIELHDSTLTGGKVSVPDLMAAALAAGFHVVSRHGPVVALDRR
jgi:FkbM family methyltransferase